jgi:hypothetical protein
VACKTSTGRVNRRIIVTDLVAGSTLLKISVASISASRSWAWE